MVPPQDLFRIGGFWDLSGFAENELSGQHVARLSGAYYRKIASIRTLSAYAGLTFETGNAWESRSEISFDGAIDAASVWLGADTPIGPVYLADGKAEGNRDSIFSLSAAPSEADRRFGDFVPGESAFRVFRCRPGRRH